MFTVLLTIFITLKLCGVITWSWGVVLIPLWIWLFFLFVGILVTANARDARW